MVLTNSNHLLPIGVIHVCIQNLLTMCQGHPSDAPGDVVEGCPQHLNNLTIHLLGSGNVTGRKAGQAGVLMAMDVKEPNPCPELQGVRNGQPWTILHSLLEMNSILAHNVIHDQGQRHAFHIEGKGFAKTIVHVNLPVDGHQDCPVRECFIMRTDLSPFWKSTTEVGTKNPWQQAVAPMPVTSRCGRLEFASSMALYVLQVLGYKEMS